jgi:hypothetical protein
MLIQGIRRTLMDARGDGNQFQLGSGAEYVIACPVRAGETVVEYRLSGCG